MLTIEKLPYWNVEISRRGVWPERAILAADTPSLLALELHALVSNLKTANLIDEDAEDALRKVADQTRVNLSADGNAKYWEQYYLTVTEDYFKLMWPYILKVWKQDKPRRFKELVTDTTKSVTQLVQNHRHDLVIPEGGSLLGNLRLTVKTEGRDTQVFVAGVEPLGHALVLVDPKTYERYYLRHLKNERQWSILLDGLKAHLNL